MPSSISPDFQVSSLFDVKGKVALVTGGATGIGLMAVQALAANGAKVYVVGRTSEKLDRVAEIYGKDISGEIIPLTADITSKADIKKLVEHISSEEQCLCILINNAGIELHTQATQAESASELSKNLFDDPDETFDTWTETYRTNVPQLYFMTLAFLPLLSKATELHHGYSGTVINISSISGIVKSSQHHYAYNASKAAAVHLTKMLAAEVSETNQIKVRINSIAPGVFPSEMTAGGSGEDQKSHIPKDKYSKVPAKRPGKETDMANAVLFMATNQYLNGQTVAVDGGYVLMAGSA